MSRPSTKPGQQMAYITIGFDSFLMESSKAMKVAELMQHAVQARLSYAENTGDYLYTANGPVNVEFKLVRPDQVRMPDVEPRPVRTAAVKRIAR